MYIAYKRLFENKEFKLEVIKTVRRDVSHLRGNVMMHDWIKQDNLLI